MTSLRRRYRRWTSDPVALTVTALASYRLTRLVTADHLPPAVRLRAWLSDHTPDEYAMLWSCPWCFGFWTSAALTATAELADRKGHRHTFLLAAAPWAISTVAGFLAEQETN